jgi:hypothetical protein
MRALIAVSAALLLAMPLAASSYTEVEKTCPIGGKKFKFMELMSISTFGRMADGMPVGSGIFPIDLPKCPDNGLVMYKDFSKADLAVLKPIVAGAEYQALQRKETVYFLAAWLAEKLGERDQVAGLLLSATWEAKNQEPGGEMARRYNEAFLAWVAALPADNRSFGSIALRVRAANALREMGRFDEAEAMRAAVVIPADAGGTDPEAADNREGWTQYLGMMAAPIARRDASRWPIDLRDDTSAAGRCIEKELARPGEVVAPLTAFETSYCADPKLGEMIRRMREARAGG